LPPFSDSASPPRRCVPSSLFSFPLFSIVFFAVTWLPDLKKMLPAYRKLFLPIPSLSFLGGPQPKVSLSSLTLFWIPTPCFPSQLFLGFRVFFFSRFYLPPLSSPSFLPGASSSVRNISPFLFWSRSTLTPWGWSVSHLFSCLFE